MPVAQRLRDSGHFEEGDPQDNGTIRFWVNGWPSSAIYVQPNDQEVHIRDQAFLMSRFPNNANLYEFVREHESGTVHGERNDAFAHRLGGEHIAQAIDIIRLGL